MRGPPPSFSSRQGTRDHLRSTSKTASVVLVTERHTRAPPVNLERCHRRSPHGKAHASTIGQPQAPSSSFSSWQGTRATHLRSQPLALKLTIISGALDLTEKTAEEAMTSIESTFSLDVNSKLDWEAMGKILARGHS